MLKQRAPCRSREKCIRGREARRAVLGFFDPENGYLGLEKHAIVRDDDFNGLKGLFIVIKCRVLSFDTWCCCD